MVVADGCRGLPNVGHHYIQGSENALCTMIGSSVNASYRPGTCTLHPTSDSAIDLHLADIFAAVMGSCSSHPTALSGLFAQTAALLASLPASTVNATLNQISGTGDTTGAYAVSSMGIIPRPPLRHVLSTAGVGLSATLSNFIDDLSGVLTCDALSGDINAVMGSFCCDFMVRPPPILSTRPPILFPCLLILFRRPSFGMCRVGTSLPSPCVAVVLRRPCLAASVCLMNCGGATMKLALELARRLKSLMISLTSATLTDQIRRSDLTM